VGVVVSPFLKYKQRHEAELPLNNPTLP
jgi:hypothetical protein